MIGKIQLYFSKTIDKLEYSSYDTSIGTSNETGASVSHFGE